MKTILLSVLLTLMLCVSGLAQVVIKVDSVLIGNSSGNTSLYGQTLLRNISLGSVADSVLVRDSLGVVKYVPGSSLGTVGGGYLKVEAKANLAAVDTADHTKRLISISSGVDEGLYFLTGLGFKKLATNDVTQNPKTARVNFTATSDPATSPNWNNFNVSAYSTLKPLLDTGGGATGWSIIASAGAVNFDIGGAIAATTNFPLDIINTLWWGSSFVPITLTISGLNVGKTYDLNIGFPVAPGADYVQISTTVSHEATTSTTHNLGLILASVEDKYTGLTPKPDGTIRIVISSVNPKIYTLAGLIIKEN